MRSKERKDLSPCSINSSDMDDLWAWTKILSRSSNGILSTATASFTAVTASAPSGFTDTNENDFLFFINGQYMEHDALTIEQSGSVFLLQVDTSGIGYDLEADDEILAVGKFNS